MEVKRSRAQTTKGAPIVLPSATKKDLRRSSIAPSKKVDTCGCALENQIKKCEETGSNCHQGARNSCLKKYGVHVVYVVVDYVKTL
jgi:hypothetical protein